MMQLQAIVPKEMVNPLRVEVTGSSDHAMHLIAFFQEQLSQKRAILTGDSRDKCSLIHVYPLICCVRTVQDL